MIWNKIYETSFTNNETLKFYFRRKSSFHRRTNPSHKVVTAQEKLDGIDIDGTGGLMDLPRLMYIDQECGNLEVAADGGQLRNNN